MEKEADVTVLGLRPDQSHYISVARWAEKDTIECMVIIEWFGVSKFPSLLKKICDSLGDFCLGLPKTSLNLKFCSKKIAHSTTNI